LGRIIKQKNNKMKNKKYIIPVFAFLLFGVFIIGISVNLAPQNSISDEITYNSMVCKQVTRVDGTVVPLECSHNVLYDTGKEAIEAYLGAGSGGGDAFDWIELCNSTLVENSCGAPSAGKAEEYLAYTGCGLVGVAATCGENAQDGNWTCYHSFTSTCDAQTTNVSRLVNDDDDDLAGNSFTEVTLQTGDKLNITWDVWVT